MYTDTEKKQATQRPSQNEEYRRKIQLSIKYDAKTRAKVDKALKRNGSPTAVAKKLGLPSRYIHSRKQFLQGQAAIAALKAQEQAAQQGAAASE